MIGEDRNRRVSVTKIENKQTRFLADYRRGDIFSKNETLSAFVRISDCERNLLIQNSSFFSINSF